MARKAKEEPKAMQASTPLSLTNASGEPLLVFQPEVVAPLRRMVTLLASDGKLPGRLGLVSALREEGVSYTSLALATIFANDLAGSVCLVELNWDWPALRSLAARGAASLPAEDAGAGRDGLAAVLTGNCDLQDALAPTGLPNLMLLPAGQLPQAGREAFVRGARLRETVAQLSERFEHVLLDVPAIAATSDAIALARLASGVILVVRQGVTPRRTVAAALDDLKTCNVLGVVLNRAKVATPAKLLKLIPQD